MIRLENVRKQFRTEEVETTALEEVTLTVEEGEFVAIMGPSGCGKSTLMNIMGMIDRPDAGDYFFIGENVTHNPQKSLTQLRKNHIGFVFQSFNLIDELTVFENVELPMLYAGGLSVSERRAKVEAVLDKVDMTHRVRHFPRQLSGGQQQRVAVARAIVNRPKLILADEPTGNLDSEHGGEVMDMLDTLQDEGTTIVMVTHSPESAQRADRVVRMLDGRIQ
ncbi:MAG: ABC transporter ATP-binding protein [Gammaproteobacteria bacterium]